jgi:hypothetical protein
MRIDDVAIPFPLLHLCLYIPAPIPLPRAISKNLIHISHLNQHILEGLGLELSNVVD